MRPFSLLLLFLLPLPAMTQPTKATLGNRLAYLDELDPYYPHRLFPKLITPQWVGEPDVDAVVILAIDDMKDPKKYETFLRPILNRLKKIDGRAPVSIMTNSIDPKDPQLQAWLREGLSLEVHTFDHPCPYFRPGFDKAKDTYDRCVDLMHAIPNSKPVCFRMPCCDSMNTPSPRHWAEIFNQKTAKGNYLSLDSSVFQVFTSDDPELPKELVLEDGKERFKKYLPMERDFVNWIENYPYPYVIGKYCWQFPCMTPSDWQAQFLHKPNNPITLRDWKAALDCTVIKKGVFNMVFHPHGWIKAEQIIDLIDHAVEKHGKKVKFLTFKEAHDRLQKSLFPKKDWRTVADLTELFDIDNDGYIDLVTRTSQRQTGEQRLWDRKKQAWNAETLYLVAMPEGGGLGVLKKNGFASLATFGWAGMGRLAPFYFDSFRHFDGTKFDFEDPHKRASASVGLRLFDIDGDGICEKIDYAGNVFAYEAKKGWGKLPFQMPTAALQFLEAPTFMKPAKMTTPAFRFLDLNADGKLDIVFSNENEWGVYLFTDMKTGWRKVRAGKAGDPDAIPMIARNGKNNGCWAHSGHLWWGNEDTHLLKNYVDRRSLKALLEEK